MNMKEGGKMDRRTFLKRSTGALMGAVLDGALMKRVDAARVIDDVEFQYSPDFDGPITPETGNAIRAWIETFLIRDSTFIYLERKRSKAKGGEFGQFVELIEYDEQHELKCLDAIKWPSSIPKKVDRVYVKIEPQGRSRIRVSVELRDQNRKWLAIVHFNKQVDTK